MLNAIPLMIFFTDQRLRFCMIHEVLSEANNAG